MICRVKLLWLAEGCGLASAIIGFSGLIGYATQEPLFYTWRAGAGMALPTAFALTASGVGVLACALSYDMRKHT